jgi:hypothetical protein
LQREKQHNSAWKPPFADTTEIFTISIMHRMREQARGTRGILPADKLSNQRRARDLRAPPLAAGAPIGCDASQESGRRREKDASHATTSVVNHIQAVTQPGGSAAARASSSSCEAFSPASYAAVGVYVGLKAAPAMIEAGLPDLLRISGEGMTSEGGALCASEPARERPADADDADDAEGVGAGDAARAEPFTSASESARLR